MPRPSEEHSGLLDVAAQFALPGPVTACEPMVGGLIHGSWRVACGGADTTQRFLLQRINTEVFAKPERVMENILAVTNHLRAKAPERPTLEFLTGSNNPDAHLLHRKDGSWWRVCRFIEGGRSLPKVIQTTQAECAAEAFGSFALTLEDFPARTLLEVIPDFHDIEARYGRLRRAAALAEDRAAGAKIELDRIEANRHLASALPSDLPHRVIHGDAKLSNVLLHQDRDEALCVVDLDTVMVGPIAWDFGDMARSMACTHDEHHPDPGAVALDRDVFASLLGGYIEGTRGLLTEAERASLFTGALAITFEQAVRYLTDHLEGDRYYHADHPGQNLARCRNQLALLASMDSQRHPLEALIP